ncbi:MAG: DUF4325 domain-containing protein [Lysobacteraceae bacterium]|nr:MAG: DUF4325 domain-containing protein [Xanthomonadaceae bacterium]
MPRPSRSVEIDLAVLEAAPHHSRDLVAHVAGLLGISRTAIAARIRQLLADGFLTKEGTTRPSYGLGAKRKAVFIFQRKGLAEDMVWTSRVAPLLPVLPRNIIDIAHYGLTEMVNNAIDHSEGDTVSVVVEIGATMLALGVIDNGVGIFEKISAALQLPDKRLALLELSKGKFTTDPRRHSGEGIFFTSRMFDVFRIASGGLLFNHQAGLRDVILDDVEINPERGTSVLMEIGISSNRKSEDVFAEYSSGPDEHAFAKTVVPVRMARVGDENLVSRSQAKRVLQRVHRFRSVIFDFSGVEKIGQAFADEIFRVFANEHPEMELIPMHATTEVQQMIRRAEILRDEDAGQLPLALINREQ